MGNKKNKRRSIRRLYSKKIKHMLEVVNKRKLLASNPSDKTSEKTFHELQKDSEHENPGTSLSIATVVTPGANPKSNYDEQHRKQPKTQSENQELQSPQSLAGISDLLQPNQDQSSLVIVEEVLQIVPNEESLLPKVCSKRNGGVSQRLGKIHENEDTSNTGNKGPTVFCSKRNGSLSRRLGKIHEDETKIVIANVYDYFEQEYAELKKCKRMDPTPLLTFSERTALATGVSETTVLEILLERARRNTDMSQKAARKRPRQPERIELQRPSQGDSVPTVEDDGESSSIAFVTETLVIKEEPSDEDNDEPEIYVEMPIVKMESSEAYMDLADPIAINLPEPRNDATEQASASSETQAVHRAIKCHKGKTTQQHMGAPAASMLHHSSETQAVHRAVECYKEKTTQQHTGAPPASMLRHSTETQSVHRAVECYKEKTTQQHTGAPPVSMLRQLLQQPAGQLRVRSTPIDEDWLS